MKSRQFVPETMDEHLDVVHHESCICEYAGDCQYCFSLIALRGFVNSPKTLAADAMLKALQDISMGLTLPSDEVQRAIRKRCDDTIALATGQSGEGSDAN